MAQTLDCPKPDPEVAAVAASVAGEEKPPEPEPQKAKKVDKADKQARLAEFRSEAEVAVAAEIEGRMVILTQDGTHQELTARLASTRLCQNLTESAKMITGIFVDHSLTLVSWVPAFSTPFGVAAHVGPGVV